MKGPYVLLLKVYGRSELPASPRDGNWIGSFRICLKILDEWELKKEMLDFFEVQVSLAVWSSKHGIILRHPLYSAGKVKGKNRDRFEQE
jgi:hypothetical protein